MAAMNRSSSVTRQRQTPTKHAGRAGNLMP